MARIEEIQTELDAQNRAFEDALEAMNDVEARCLSLSLAPFESLVEAFDTLDVESAFPTLTRPGGCGIRG